MTSNMKQKAYAIFDKKALYLKDARVQVFWRKSVAVGELEALRKKTKEPLEDLHIEPVTITRGHQ